MLYLNRFTFVLTAMVVEQLMTRQTVWLKWWSSAIFHEDAIKIAGEEHKEQNLFRFTLFLVNLFFSPNTVFASLSYKPEAFSLLNWTWEVSSNQPLTDWTCQPSKRLIGFGDSEVSAFTKWASPGFSGETECSIKSHFRLPPFSFRSYPGSTIR